MSRRVPPIRPHGFSLVELLIAMTLGLLLISGTVAVFAGNKRSADVNTAMANLQENARFALDAIARDVRMAGFQGCIDLNKGDLNVAATAAPTTNLRATAALGYTVASATSWSPTPVAGFTPTTAMRAVPGSHALSLQFGGPETRGLSAQMNDGASTDPSPSRSGDLLVDAGPSSLGLSTGDYAIVSSCDTGDLFRVTGANDDNTVIEHAAGANSSANLTRAYGDAQTRTQTMLMPFSSNIYFVADTNLENEAGDEIRALYRQSLPYTTDNPPIELIQGVENLRVAFGMRQPTGALRYVAPGDSAFDATRVEAVQIGVLMSSWDSIAEVDDGRTYLLAGQAVPAADDPSDVSAHAKDRRMRLAFNTTVRIRNRRPES